MKTVEELAREWCNRKTGFPTLIEAYAAGYNKAKEWISVEDRLPERFKKVLVCVHIYAENYQSESNTCGYYDLGWHIDRSDSDIKHFEVTHWKYIDLL